MNFDEIIQKMNRESKQIMAIDAEKCVPNDPGLYSIFITDENKLPPIFSNYLKRNNSKIVYFGKATKNLQVRLVEQDLRHKSPSTFFRGIGAVLGYLPPAGSLIGKGNQYNYKFSKSDTTSIIKWINENMHIKWVPLTLEDIDLCEQRAINIMRPVLNTTHNQDALPELALLREKCRIKALS